MPRKLHNPRVTEDRIAVFLTPPATTPATAEDLDCAARQVMEVLLSDRCGRTFGKLLTVLTRQDRSLLPDALQLLIDNGRVRVTEGKGGRPIGRRYYPTAQAEHDAWGAENERGPHSVRSASRVPGRAGVGAMLAANAGGVATPSDLG